VCVCVCVPPHHCTHSPWDWCFF